jgi:DNA-binding SARP family transcriptional activator
MVGVAGPEADTVASVLDSADPPDGPIAEPIEPVVTPPPSPPDASSNGDHDPTNKVAGPCVELLGPPRVSGVGTPERQQLIDVAVALALDPYGITREELNRRVWGGTAADGTISARLANLRKWLGDEATVIETDGVLRLGDRVRCDWWEFDRLAGKTQTRPAAIAMVRGTPLEGALPKWDDIDERQERLIARVMAVCLEEADAALAAARASNALDAAETARRVCRWDERATRSLMKARKAAGYSTSAIRAAVADAEDLKEPNETLEPETIGLLHELTSTKESTT